MIPIHSLQQRLLPLLGGALLSAAVYAGSTGLVIGADNKAPDPKAAGTAAPKKADQVKKKLSGADLYAINCNRCHPERYPTEFNAAGWKSLMTHMRVRANLPAKQAREILKYLQEESGS